MDIGSHGIDYVMFFTRNRGLYPISRVPYLSKNSSYLYPKGYNLPYELPCFARNDKR